VLIFVIGELTID